MTDVQLPLCSVGQEPALCQRDREIRAARTGRWNWV